MKKIVLLTLLFSLLTLSKGQVVSLPVVEALLGKMVGTEAVEGGKFAMQVTQVAKQGSDLKKMLEELKKAGELYNKVAGVVKNSQRLIDFFEYEEKVVKSIYNTQKNVSNNKSRLKVNDVKHAYSSIERLIAANNRCIKQITISCKNDANMTTYQRLQQIDNSLVQCRSILSSSSRLNRQINMKILNQLRIEKVRMINGY